MAVSDCSLRMAKADPQEHLKHSRCSCCSWIVAKLSIASKRLKGPSGSKLTPLTGADRARGWLERPKSHGRHGNRVARRHGSCRRLVFVFFSIFSGVVE